MNGDIVVGGSGIDELVADFSARTSALTFTALDSLATYAVAGFTVTGVERYYLTGTAFGDNITGWLHDHAVQSSTNPADVLITLGDDTLTLKNVTVTSLHAGDFIVSPHPVV